MKFKGKETENILNFGEKMLYNDSVFEAQLVLRFILDGKVRTLSTTKFMSNTTEPKTIDISLDNGGYEKLLKAVTLLIDETADTQKDRFCQLWEKENEGK